MEIITKFKFNDEVIPIYRRTHIDNVGCGLCKSHGIVKIEGSSRTIQCPDCHGLGRMEEKRFSKWAVGYDSVGKINRVVVIKNRDESSPDNMTSYEIDGASSRYNHSWNEKDLFFSEVDAQEECDKRNPTSPKTKQK